MTQKLISLCENDRSGLINSALTSTFMMRSLPVPVPIIAWQNMRSFTFCGLVEKMVHLSVSVKKQINES